MQSGTTATNVRRYSTADRSRRRGASANDMVSLAPGRPLYFCLCQRRVSVGTRTDPFVCPGSEGGDDRFQGPPFFGEFVLDADGRGGNDVPDNDFLCLEFLQSSGQHLVTHIGHRSGDVAETPGAVQHRAHDNAGPSAPDQLDGVVEVGAEVVLR